MATFTVRLKDVIRLTGGTETLVTTTQFGAITKVVGAQLGLDSYPIYDEGHRDILNGKIVDHYYNREIGLETIDMFQLAVRRRLNEIMPVYNLLYLSTQIQFDPLSTIDMHTATVSDSLQTTTSDGTSNANTDTKSGSRSVQSTAPQNTLRPDGEYATGMADANSDTTGNSDTTEHSAANADSNATSSTDITGYQGVASDLLMRYRESIINVDMMVIRDLEECFMLLWDNADEYSERGLY